MERPKAGGRAQGGRRGASLLEAARSGRVLRSLANTASAAAAENNLNSGTRAAKKRLSESPACSDAFVRRVLPRLPRGEQAPAAVSLAPQEGDNADEPVPYDLSLDLSGDNIAHIDCAEATELPPVCDTPTDVRASAGSSSKQPPWLSPTSAAFPFTFAGGRRQAETVYLNSLSSPHREPYTSLNARHFSTATRQLVVDFMVCICTEWSFQEETLHMALRLLDDYLRTKAGGADAFVGSLHQLCRPSSHATRATGGGGSASSRRQRRRPSAALPASSGGLVLPDVDSSHILPCAPLRCLVVAVIRLAVKLCERADSMPFAADMAENAQVMEFHGPGLVVLESSILHSLRFKLSRPTAVAFAMAYVALMPTLQDSASDHALPGISADGISIDASLPQATPSLATTVTSAANYLLDVSLYALESMGHPPPSLVATACVSLALHMTALWLTHLHTAGQLSSEQHAVLQVRVAACSSVLASATAYEGSALAPVDAALARCVLDAHSITRAGCIRGLAWKHGPHAVQNFGRLAALLMTA